MNYKMLVNKKNLLKKDFIPENLIDGNEFLHEDSTFIEVDGSIRIEKEAYENFVNLREEALKEGYKLYVESAYRSYGYQEKLLNYYIKKYGEEETLRFCALPGTSEHQTGLALDLGYVDENNQYHEEVAEDTSEYKWLIENSYKFGFVLRYPDGKEEITGYKFEPWHFRYLGIDFAKEIYEYGKTLEEYYEEKEA